MRTGISIAFIGAGILHFTNARFFQGLVPAETVANRATVNIVGGILIIAIGIAFLLPRFLAVARWIALALLVATLPLTAYRALHPAAAQSVGLSPVLVGGALIAWLLMIALIWWATTADPSER